MKYFDEKGKLTVYQQSAVPSSLQQKFLQLQHMIENLSVDDDSKYKVLGAGNHQGLYVRRLICKETLVAMQLCNGTVQVIIDTILNTIFGENIFLVFLNAFYTIRNKNVITLSVLN